MLAAPIHSEPFGIHYDRTVVRDVMPIKLMLWYNEPVAVISETETTYVVLSGMARIAKVPEDSKLWTRQGRARIFDKKLYDEMPAIREVAKDELTECKSWCHTGINWDNYYALNEQDLPKDPYTTDGRYEVRETELFGFKVYCKRVHNVRW